MTLIDKVEGRTKQLVGEVLGDGRLFAEGKQQARAEDAPLKSTPPIEDPMHEISSDKARS